MLTLRPALESDREFSRCLHHACYRDVVERQFGSWNQELQDRFFSEGWILGESQIVECEGVPLGVFRCSLLTDHFFIHEIQIHPDSQGQGIGSRLIRDQIEEARRLRMPLRLRVLRSNRAYELYSRLGFDETERDEVFIFMEWSEGGGHVA